MITWNRDKQTDRHRSWTSYKKNRVNNSSSCLCLLNWSFCSTSSEYFTLFLVYFSLSLYLNLWGIRMHYSKAITRSTHKLTLATQNNNKQTRQVLVVPTTAVRLQHHNKTNNPLDKFWSSYNISSSTSKQKAFFKQEPGILFSKQNFFYTM